MSKHFLKEANREKLQVMANMIRYNNAVHVHHESVAEHTFFVAFYTMAICDLIGITGVKAKIAIEEALIHDVHETELSDIPHNIKEIVPGLEQNCLTFEKMYNTVHFKAHEREMNELKTTEEVELIKTVVLIADTLSVIQYSTQEYSLGNTQRFLEIKNKAIGRMKRILEDNKELLGFSAYNTLYEYILGVIK